MTQSSRFKKTLEGIVVSDINDKTIVVKVTRKFKDQVYSKFVNTSRKFHAQDSNNTAKKGDVVTIIESKPFSRLKKWELLKVN